VPHINDGKLRALAVTNTSRSQALPQVPTMVEAGYPEIVGDTWFGVLVPAGTPREINGWLNRAIAKVLVLPDVKERALALGFEPVGNTAEEFAAQIKSDGAKWAKVILDAGIKAR
jgi:tripartite-type tricarboxylate transporter receptor subunit TctC